MGAYVNPKNETKETWLEREGDEVETIDYDNIPENKYPVVLVDNGTFTAGAIAFHRGEWEVFDNPDDTRPRRFFLVDIEKLHKVSPELKDYETETQGRYGNREGSNPK